MLHVATDRQIAPREIQGTEVRYVKLAPKKFFGWEDMISFGRPFRVSTAEKTIMDCVDRPDLCGGIVELARIVARGTDTTNDDSLVDCALRLGSVSACQRLGYMLDLTAPQFLSSEQRRRLRDFIPSSARSSIGHQHPDSEHVGYVHEWGLFVNASEDDLLAEVPQHRQPEVPSRLS